MVTSIINESKVQERRSKTFTNLHKNDINGKDVSNVKFYSFMPFRNIPTNNNNLTVDNELNDTNTMINTPVESLDISFIPKNKKTNNNKHFKTIDKSEYFTDNDLLNLDEHDKKTIENININEDEPIQEKTNTLDKINKLDPILESSNDKLNILMDSCRTIDLTKDDVDRVILNFALNSESTMRKNKNNKDNHLQNSNDIMRIGDKTITTGNKIFSFNSKLQKYWFAIFIKTGVILEKVEIIIYENFWFTLLYLNFWFPKFAGFLRYVKFYLQFFLNLNILFTNIFFLIYIIQCALFCN